MYILICLRFSTQLHTCLNFYKSRICPSVTSSTPNSVICNL